MPPRPAGIEALVLELSDPDKIEVTVGWTQIVDRRSAAQFAAAVHAMTRSSRGLTAIGPALAASAAQFDRLPQPAARRVVDISGDGIANLGAPPRLVRDRLVSGGITINGLAISTDAQWLADYYRNNVIGGPGAFVVTARDYHGFADAMRPSSRPSWHALGTGARSDAIGADRGEAVEPDRGVARGVGAGRQDLDLVADF